jgi:hypothetical protein
VPDGPAVHESAGDVEVPETLHPSEAGLGADGGNAPPFVNAELVTVIVSKAADVPGGRSGVNAPPTYVAFPSAPDVLVEVARGAVLDDEHPAATTSAMTPAASRARFFSIIEKFSFFYKRCARHFSYASATSPFATAPAREMHVEAGCLDVTKARRMLDTTLAGRAEIDYQARRTQLIARLEHRLVAATHPARAVRAAARSMKARCDAARHAISEALASQRGTVASATDLAVIFDRLVARETASCINAVATVAGRWSDPNATMAAAEAAVARAYTKGRDDVLRHLADDANESRWRLRPLPVRLVRSGFNTLVGGGLLWRGWLWVSQHWPQIAAHLHH